MKQASKLSPHFNHLATRIPDIVTRKIIDIGAGRGKFLFAAAERGIEAVGLEPSRQYVDIIRTSSKECGLEVSVVEGSAEEMPFPDETFGFANMAEVIEHVEDPERVLAELHRILQKGGIAYVSVPNRFGLKDPHYHLFCINWMQRALAENIIHFLKKSKKDGDAGRQRLLTMHYFTLSAFRKLAKHHGFSVRDIREERIREIVPTLFSTLAVLAYRIVGYGYFDTFHLLLVRKQNSISYVTAARMPTEKAHGVSIAHMCAAFAAQGMAVELVVPSRHNLVTENLFAYYGVPETFSIRIIPTPDFVGRGLTHPMFFFLQRMMFAHRVKRAGIASTYVYTREPEIVSVLGDTHSVVYEAHRWPRGVAGKVTAHLLRKAALIVANSRGTAEAVTASCPVPTIVAPNGFDPSLFGTPVPSRKVLGLPEGVLALYVGSDAPWKGIDVVRHAAEGIDAEALSVAIVGGKTTSTQGALYELGRVRPATVPAYLRSADILILPNTSTSEESEYFTSPIKLFEYLAAGKAIVASDVPSIREILSDTDAVFVPSGDASALREALLQLSRNPDIRAQKAMAAAQLAPQFTWNARAEKILQAVAKI